MKKILLFALLLAGCAKNYEEWRVYESNVGKHFKKTDKNIKLDYYNFDPLPTNPFKIDSINHSEFSGNGGYYVHSDNGYHFMISGYDINNLKVY